MQITSEVLHEKPEECGLSRMIYACRRRSITPPLHGGKRLVLGLFHVFLTSSCLEVRDHSVCVSLFSYSRVLLRLKKSEAVSPEVPSCRSSVLGRGVRDKPSSRISEFWLLTAAAALG